MPLPEYPVPDPMAKGQMPKRSIHRIVLPKPVRWDEMRWAWPEGYQTQTEPKHKVVAIDYGAKRNILRCLASTGCEVVVLPADATAQDILAHNPDGVFLVSQAAIPALKQTKGAIVNIGSISGLRASTLRVAYGTSKAAVIHMTKQQAIELGDFGVRANCVCPGPVKTKLAMAVHSPEIISAYLDAMPLGRYGSEREIAEVIAFLCSDKASYVTGQIIAADGGFETAGVGLPALRKAAQE
mgnify:CR=1 FL=1